MSHREEDGEEGMSEQNRKRNPVYEEVKKQTKRGSWREREGCDMGVCVGCSV